MAGDCSEGDDGCINITVDRDAKTITINGAKEMLRIGQILADSITRRKPEECHVVVRYAAHC